ncbi:MAG TPA: hypothetical protein VK879_17305 [Candidatus Sulfomarinibacteraceae bacterium]|nr:hypothetical protein [Candidatus Sulfomarinibacteraceae bacterium]
MALVAGVLCGVLLVLAFGRWVLAPASAQMRRGYFNAFVAGLLLAAAIEVLPNALEGAGIAGHQALSSLLFPDGELPPDSIWLFVLEPVNVQVAVRAVGAALVMVIFFRANAAPRAEDGDANEAGQAAGDGLALLAVTAGLAAHNLWLGLTRGLFASGPASAELALAALGTTLLGASALGLVPSLRSQWWQVVVVSLALGLAGGAGALWRGNDPALQAALLPMLIGAGCLVYGIGRLLRLLQGEIGLGWRTTAAVAVGVLVLYQSRLLL